MVIDLDSLPAKSDLQEVGGDVVAKQRQNWWCWKEAMIHWLFRLKSRYPIAIELEAALLAFLLYILMGYYAIRSVLAFLR